jgi:hypothetical protein
MATILARGSNRLVFALFGQRLELVKEGSVSCTATGTVLTETPQQMLIIANQGLAWFETTSPRTPVAIGPCFGQQFRFEEGVLGQPSCFATHQGQPGVNENPTELRAVLGVVQNWLVAAGVT